MLLAAVGRDPQHRRLFAESAPERARLPAQVPARLVDVKRARRARLLEQLLVDRLKRFGGAAEDRIDRADCDRTAEQLLHQLDQLPPRETIPDRERRYCRLQLRTETTARHSGRQPGSHRAAAVGTADALQAVLAELDRKRRQLRHLMPRRHTGRLTLTLVEDMAARAALWPVVNDVGHSFDRKQRAPVARMLRLSALLAPRPPRPAALPHPGRVVARRQRRVTRVALQPLLELLNTLRQRRQLRVLRLQSRRQRQQRLDRRLLPGCVDRLGPRALYTGSFAAPNRVPAD